MFADSRAYLNAELQRLDLLLHRQILRLRAAYKLSLDEFRGLYISDQQVDSLVGQFSAERNAGQSIEELTARAEAIRESNLEQLSDDLPWTQTVKEFGLSMFEQDVLLLALAPEIDLKYETLYSYLNNDITRKLPTFDLALRLFSECDEERTSLRSFLFPSATLLRTGLLKSGAFNTEHHTWLASSFFLAPFVSHYLLGLDHDLSESCLQTTTVWEDVPVRATLRSELAGITSVFNGPAGDKPPLAVFEAQEGSGRRLAAQALCRSLDLPMMHFDLEMIRSGSDLNAQLETLILKQRLRRAALYIQHAEFLFDREGNPVPESRPFLRSLGQVTLPVFIAFAAGTPWRGVMQDLKSIAFDFGDLDYSERYNLWNEYVERSGNDLSQALAEMLASRFVLTAGQIRNAVAAAELTGNLRSGYTKSFGVDDLLKAARGQSDQSLGRLSIRVSTIYSWDDLVLPKTTLRQVKEIAAAIKNRHVVYSQWGFEQRISYGKGLKVLFAGPSGTGKTMTAGVIARELGCDLYKIDLSSVVSKYIGETEKNLDRIFRAAHSSNSILFFDEADALFGKRSEVKDAHDRYANIEVAYLLQKVEEHEGAVILASNLSKNIDDAFSRRMHYVIEFPLPGEAHREQLWRNIFPAKTPIAKDVDFHFLAKQFQISGGDIKNVALEAAFLAADDGQLITMRELVKAMARQMTKQGRIPSPTDFKQYHALIRQ